MSASRSDPHFDKADVPVGVALARLRRRAGLTGKELGDLLGMSQAKVSKIETGAVNPSPDDVERMARQLGAAADEIDRLAHQAEQHRDRMMDWRVGRNDPATWQHELGQLEAGATELRVFQFGLISGLLQTSEYAREVLATVQEAWADSTTTGATRVNQAVSERMRRQQILDDTGKRFHFILPEAVLHNMLTGPEDMLAQLGRLRRVAGQDNVVLSMIPEDERWPYPPFHNFSVLDDRQVIIDLANTVVVTPGRSDIQFFRGIFDKLEQHATRDVEPILDKHSQRYLQLIANRQAR